MSKQLLDVARQLPNAGPGRFAQSQRLFSTSRLCASRILFKETKSTELNAALNEIQEKIIIPAHLPKKQKALLMAKTQAPALATQKAYLAQNPIVFEIDGQERKFSAPLKYGEDIPPAAKVLAKALNEMSNAGDFSELSVLLAGFSKAGIVPTEKRWSKIIRVAAKSGKIASLIPAIDNAKQTKFYLNAPEPTMRLFTALAYRIVDDPSLETIQHTQDLSELFMHLAMRDWRDVRKGKSFWLQRNFFVSGLQLFVEACNYDVRNKSGLATKADYEHLEGRVQALNQLWKHEKNEKNDLTKKQDVLDELLKKRQYGQVVRILAANQKAMMMVKELGIAGPEGDETFAAAIDTLRTRREKVLEELRQTVASAPDYGSTALDLVLEAKPQKEEAPEAEAEPVPAEAEESKA